MLTARKSEGVKKRTILEIIENYKLRMPPTVYYDLLADVLELEEEQEPTTKNDLGVDCISRQDVLSEIIRFSTEEGASVECQQLYCDVNNMPSVTPQEPKTGHWDSIQGYIMDIAWNCSECGEFTCKKHNYCPHCGAKMESEEV